MDEQLTVTRSENGVLVVVGELDIATTPQLAAAADEVPLDEEVVFDFGGVTFIDSAGVRALVLLARERPIRLSRKSAAVQRLFELLGFDQAFGGGDLGDS